jgi:hypothetical protein
MLIMLTGQIIGIPFVIWLIFTVFYFGSIDQLFAMLAIFGIVLHLTKWKSNIIAIVLSFLLMLSPIISRLVRVPIEMFNYLAFQIPLITFVLTYLIYIIINIKQKKYG